MTGVPSTNSSNWTIFDHQRRVTKTNDTTVKSSCRMPFPFRQIFRKDDGDSLSKRARNEDLESACQSSLAQTPIAIESHSFSGPVHLPETKNISTLGVPETSTSSSEYFYHVQRNGQFESAAQVPFTTSISSGAKQHPTRTTCGGISPSGGPMAMLVTPSQPPDKASSGDCVGDNGPQHCSTSIPSTVSQRRCPSPKPREKHDRALHTLETCKSSRKLPASQQDVVAISRSSISLPEFGWILSLDDHTAGLHDSLHQQPENVISAVPHRIINPTSKVDLPSSTIQYLPNAMYPSGVLHQRGSSQSVKLLEELQTADESHVKNASPFLLCPLPNDSKHVTQQSLESGQVPIRSRRALSMESSSLGITAADALPDLLSGSPSNQEIYKTNTLKRMVQSFGSGTERGKAHEDAATYQVGEGKEVQSLTGDSNLDDVRQDHTTIQSRVFEEMNEYTWSPLPSDDGQESQSICPKSAPQHAPLDILCAYPPSGLEFYLCRRLSQPVSPMNQHKYSWSGSLGNPSGIDNSLPNIDGLIPVTNTDLGSHSDFLSSSQHVSKTETRESSNIVFRYSDLITQSVSSRPYSEMEFEEVVLDPLEDRGKSGSSVLSSRNSSGQADCSTSPEQSCEEHKPDVPLDAFSHTQAHNHSRDAGPGSSQTSSSLGIDYNDGLMSGRKSFFRSPSSRVRCPTPRMLFGKKTTSSSVPGGLVGRFGRTSRPTRLEETGSFPKALCSFTEQDWETVTAATETHTQMVDCITFHTQTGGSLADNSDSGNLSMLHDTPSTFRSSRVRRVLQNSVCPRLNRSFMLLQNLRSGGVVYAPRSEYTTKRRLPNRNAVSDLESNLCADRTYRHPPPLPVEHNHPFISTPPFIGFAKSSAVSGEDGNFSARQKLFNSHLSESDLSRNAQLQEKQAQDLSYKTTPNMSQSPGSVVNQHEQKIDLKGQSNQSSAWLSTASEVASSEPSLPEYGYPFTRSLMWDRKGHKEGTLGRRRDGQTRSILVDASSLEADFPSSPTSLASSFTRSSNTPPSLVKDCCKPAYRRNSGFRSEHVPANFYKLLVGSFEGKEPIASTSHRDKHSRSYSAYEPQPQQFRPLLGRQRSSRENDSSFTDSASVQLASTVNLQSSDNHAQHITTSRPLLTRSLSHSGENSSRHSSSQQEVIDRRGPKPTMDGVSTEHPTTSSSIDSRLVVPNGAAHVASFLSVLSDPIGGCNRLRDRIALGSVCLRPHLERLERPLFQRLIARAESPHLLHTSPPPIPGLAVRHMLLSRVYLIMSMGIPPIALVYGHGYLDGMMRWHTEGAIDGFRSREKIVALWWGYGSSAVCAFTLIIAVIIMSASA